MDTIVKGGASLSAYYKGDYASYVAPSDEGWVPLSQIYLFASASFSNVPSASPTPVPTPPSAPAAPPYCSSLSTASSRSTISSADRPSSPAAPPPAAPGSPAPRSPASPGHAGGSPGLGRSAAGPAGLSAHHPAEDHQAAAAPQESHSDQPVEADEQQNYYSHKRQHGI